MTSPSHNIQDQTWKVMLSTLSEDSDFFCSPVLTSPGSLSDLITMLRHNMAAISEIGEFRIHFALFAVCSVLLGLSTHSSSRSGQERKGPCVVARWRSKTNDNDVKCYWKYGTVREICIGNHMISSAIWDKSARVNFSKANQIARARRASAICGL